MFTDSIFAISLRYRPSALFALPVAPSLDGWPANDLCVENTGHLLLEHLFNLADLVLDLAGDSFGLAFSLEVGIVRSLSRFLFGFTLQLMKFARDLILRARFHLLFSSFVSKMFRARDRNSSAAWNQSCSGEPLGQPRACQSS